MKRGLYRNLKSKKLITIIIIDSGIDISKSDLDKYTNKETGFIFKNGCIFEEANSRVKNKHGTTIALIIKNICKNVEFISMNILNENLRADGRVLIYALKQALLLKPDIIHLSLGTTNLRYFFSFKKIIKQAKKSNIIIVAAASNNRSKSYPACLKGVVGVKGDLRLSNLDFRYKHSLFYAPFNTKGIKEIDDIMYDGAGNSMAAAYITGHIACVKFFYNETENSKVIEYLKYNALRRY